MNLFADIKDVCRKALILLGTPAMLLPYAHWRFLKIVTNPRIFVQGHPLAGFRNFGEFFNYRSTIANPREELFIKSFLHDCKLACVDVGANIGQFAVLFTVAGKGEVHCFEPHPYCFSMLQKNCAGERFILNQVAVSDRECRCRFTDNGHSTHINRISTDAECAESGSLLDVKSVTLDSYLKELNVERVRLMKVDTEGAEVLVLSGCKEYLSLQAIDALLVELSPDNLRRFGFGVGDLNRLLSRCGYFPNSLDEQGKPERQNWSDLEALQLANIVFLPE